MKKEQLVMTKHLVLVAVLLLVGCNLLQAQNLLPTLKLKVSPMTAVVPATVVLTATCPTCVAYAWNFGDGTSNSVPGSAQTHVYSTSGQFDAVVAATDKNGNPVEADVLITLSSSSLADNRYCGLGDVWLGGGL
jgi:PKD repeat protein